MAKFVDISGCVYGRLTVIEKAGYKYNRIVWRCKCECGNEAIVSTSNLNSGNSNSCGCISREIIISRNTSHGLSGSDLYHVWKTMRQRCNNPQSHDYKFYGALGVSITPEWSDYKSFYEWSMKNGYKKGLTLDRKDSTKSYSPDNCRWATWKQQGENRRISYSELGKRNNAIRREKKRNLDLLEALLYPSLLC